MDATKGLINNVLNDTTARFNSVEKILVELISFFVLALAVFKYIPIGIDMVGQKTGWWSTSMQGFDDRVAVQWNGVARTGYVDDRVGVSNRVNFLGMPGSGPDQVSHTDVQVTGNSASGYKYSGDSGAAENMRSRQNYVIGHVSESVAEQALRGK